MDDKKLALIQSKIRLPYVLICIYIAIHLVYILTGEIIYMINPEKGISTDENFDRVLIYGLIVTILYFSMSYFELLNRVTKLEEKESDKSKIDE